jgi:hypothetical protein
VPSVVLATCADLPDGDDDGPELLAACRGVGLTVEWRAWDDPRVDWAAADLVVIRSTWDYPARRSEFLEWAHRVPRLANPAQLVDWNSDKRYLAGLAAVGVPTVPSRFFAPGEEITAPDDAEYVVKPAIGSGSMGAARFAGAADLPGARAHARHLHDAGRTVLVQPYLADVDASGETGLVYFAGRYSHAIRKGPMLPSGTVNPVDGRSLFVEESITARTPSAAEQEVGDRVLAALDLPWLYARVDLLPTGGGPVLIELEVTEPSLFLNTSPGSAGRLAEAIATWAAA